MKKLSVSQIRSLVRSQLNEAAPLGHLASPRDDKHFFTVLQDQIEHCSALTTELIEEILYLQSMAASFGDPEFEFDSDAIGSLHMLSDELEEYAMGVDATAEIVVDEYSA